MRPILVIIIMTFQNLLDQLQKLTPEQLKQEVMFVKCGAGSEYDWRGIAEDEYYESAQRLKLKTDPEGVWYIDNDYNEGISEDLTKEELAMFSHKEEIVPPNMPFFAIQEVK